MDLVFLIGAAVMIIAFGVVWVLPRIEVRSVRLGGSSRLVVKRVLCLV